MMRKQKKTRLYMTAYCCFLLLWLVAVRVEAKALWELCVAHHISSSKSAAASSPNPVHLRKTPHTGRGMIRGNSSWTTCRYARTGCRTRLAT
ncbi:hypothetical protein OE88DRAFT_1656295 [Heliocybe sulcata]|uniref:Secreted protein n=1 Tax=Heliocybe sulcata TaxID=5364 RepID=A0A5C3N8C9_9AGAM|nr:hypothetical protein OE88DRAFT_1656295 [Heliocybe sulcata]